MILSFPRYINSSTYNVLLFFFSRHSLSCKLFLVVQGSFIQMTNIDSFLNGRDGLTVLSDHNARITCMRLDFMKGFLLPFLNLFRSCFKYVGKVKKNRREIKMRKSNIFSLI